MLPQLNMQTQIWKQIIKETEKAKQEYHPIIVDSESMHNCYI